LPMLRITGPATIREPHQWVHLLFQFSEEMLADGRTVRVHAPAGPARHVLT
jgi:hypothetical protein